MTRFIPWIRTLIGAAALSLLVAGCAHTLEPGEVGMVSGADLLRVGGGRIEIRARTRSAPAPLAAALSRDADAMISLSDVQTAGDVIRLKARLRAPAAPDSGSHP